MWSYWSATPEKALAEIREAGEEAVAEAAENAAPAKPRGAAR